jgi:RND family efflux transporter MFP subunit
LLPISPEVRSANEEALNKLRSAETDASAVRQRLILYGMSPARVDSLRNASQITSELAMPAPVSGTVTSRSVNPGEVVEANKELLKITDLSNVWVIAQVYERDLGRLREGTGATITSDSFPEKVFRGHVAYIDPQLDETTRTAKVRIEVANPGQALKLGMYVKIALASQGTAERTTPVIPTSAVQAIGDQQIVFVATSDATTFELRPVRLGAESNGKYQVLEGLTVGDRIVTNGTFALRAEWQKSRQGAEHQH